MSTNRSQPASSQAGSQAASRKKLIEVALPLEAINVASAREKSIRHGHPSTLHLWWARRPLAACRAVLFASLVDDPDSDPAYRKPDGSLDEERAAAKRAQLFDLIEELVQWENSNNAHILNKARAEIARCVASRKIETGELKKDTIIYGANKGKAHPKGPVSGQGITAWDVNCRAAPPEVVNAFLAEHAPPVLDPFCGGGSIPLEAQRLGLVAHASDLNPVAVLITKAMIEIPPKFANRQPVNPEARKRLATATYRGAAGLAEDVRYYGKWLRDEAYKRIGHLYPKITVTEEMAKERPDLKEYIGEEITVLAWLWARTVKCPNPACRGEIPLARSFLLASKPGKKAWIEPAVDKLERTVRFEVKTGNGSPREGTVNRSTINCIFCATPVSFGHIRTLGQEGSLGARMMAVVGEGNRGRVYLGPQKDQESVAKSVHPQQVPDTRLPEQALGFRVQRYGMVRHRDLFTPRQLTALTTFCDLVLQTRDRVLIDATRQADSHQTKGRKMEAPAYANAVITYLGLAASKAADNNSTICSWMPGIKYEVVRNTYSRQALPMTWDYAEPNPFAGSSGDYYEQIARTAKTLEIGTAGEVLIAGVTQQKDCAGSAFPWGILFSTDPPYYDNIGYADLSDFFYIWLRRALGTVYPDLFGTVLVPKKQELIADAFRHKGRDNAKRHFEEGLGKAFSLMHPAQHSDYPLSVFYAFKQIEGGDDEDDEAGDISVASSTGWETMLEGLIHAGFATTGTWPMRTERSARSRNIASNALASSIVLVCRPRPANAPQATRKEFITALRNELPEALRNLQRGNIAPVDLAQAAIGPGMAVFTRYAKVMESDGSPMRVRTALQLINQALDEVLAEQEGEFDAATRWALAWFEQHGMDEGPFGVAETLSKAKNTAVNALVEAGVITARGGKVRLVKRDELPDNWDPAADGRLTVWEATQHLIRALDKQGESGAAALMKQLGATAEIARDLAYRLYTVCERKKWADEALAYNGLVIAWPELTRLAQAAGETAEEKQAELF